LSNTILPGRAGGTVDAAVSKTVGATPREGSNPSPGTLRDRELTDRS
jgi:hypothetical protein